jgi:CDP-diglyceride synthetase
MQIWLANELLLMLVVVNGAPVALGLLARRRLDTPVDGGLVLRDGRRLLGPSKTVRGVIAAILAGSAAAPLADLTYLQGAIFGSLAMAGDLVSSFLKRRLGHASSHSCPVLDQLPESLLPLLVVNPHLHAGPPEILVAAAAFTVIDLLVTRIIRPVNRRAGDAG